MGDLIPLNFKGAQTMFNYHMLKNGIAFGDYRIFLVADRVQCLNSKGRFFYWQSEQILFNLKMAGI